MQIGLRLFAEFGDGGGQGDHDAGDVNATGPEPDGGVLVGTEPVGAIEPEEPAVRRFDAYGGRSRSEGGQIQLERAIV